MKKDSGLVVCAISSYWNVFRLIFVIFCLFLIGDAFYRWDGFSYHSSFSEFLPSVALITILWSIVAMFAAMLIWLPLRVFEWLCLCRGWKVKAEIWLSFIGALLFLGVITWIGKRLIWHGIGITIQEKWVVFLGITLTAIFLSWLFRNKAEQWISIIRERITPLVWLFSIWVVLSVLLVAYHTLWNHTDNAVSQKLVQSTEAGKNKPNIILVTFDAMTARDMSVYGYHRPTTPYISKWAKTASLFTRAQADSNFTTATAASLMTGKRVWTHQILQTDASMPVRSNIENLPLLLKNNGYYNMAFIANTFASVKRLGIADSFEIAPLPSEFITPRSWYGFIDKSLYQLFGKKIQLYDWILKKDFILWKLLKIFYSNFTEFSITETPPEKAFNSFLTTIDNNPPEPFFSWIHVYPPHDPYLPPEPYMGMYNSSAKLRTYTSQLFTSWDDKDRNDIARARYDEFIRYCDKQFEDFIEQLAERNKLKNSIIILSSDHGESFEHNYSTHGGAHLYEQATHIPFIVKESSQTEGKIINELVAQIDIPATILDLANIPVPSWMEGRSLVPLLHGKKLPSRSVFSMNFWLNQGRGHQITKGTIAVWEDNYKLIHYLDKKKSLLFNLKQDPDEMNNLFDKEPETGQHLLSLIQDNLEKANKKIRTERKNHSALSD